MQLPFEAQPGCWGGVRKSSVETRGKTPKLEVLKKAPLGLPPSIALENSHHPVGGHMENASMKPTTNEVWLLP